MYRAFPELEYKSYDKLPDNFVFYKNELLYSHILTLFDDLGLVLEYDKYDEVLLIDNKQMRSNISLYSFKFNFENNVITISALRKRDEKMKFVIPVLALYLCIILIKYDFKYMNLHAIPKYGMDYCLLCYYQKFGFQPVRNKYQGSYLKSLDEALEILEKVNSADDNNPYKSFNILNSDMIVDRETLSLNVYNMLKNNKLCSKYLNIV